MSRRRSHKQDSLELLLDTICNTFGGVLFIAILVVMLLQQTGGAPAIPSPAPASPVELHSLATQMEAAVADLERLRQNRDSQQAVAQNFAPEAIRELLARRREVTATQEAFQAQVDGLRIENATLAGQVESLSEENAAVGQSLGEALARRTQAQAELERERQARVEEVRMPVVRSSPKQEIGLILRYGRLYVWHKYGAGNERLGLNTDDFVVVSEETDGLVTRPKPTAGVVLDGTAASQEAIRAVLRRFDKRTCHLAVIVRPDTYAAFRHLRDRAIELGFEYRLMPVETDTPIADRGGRGGKVQ